MSREEILRAVGESLAAVAPEADPATLDPRARLREELDLDSMDFLHFVIGLHRRLGVEVPERDYARLATLDGVVAYLEAALAAPAAAGAAP
jgi:acyl carrier protein